MHRGNNIPTSIPVFMLEFAEISPTILDPSVQPISPPRAISANIKVPPLSLLSPARLKTPGHITPTNNPQSAIPDRESKGIGDIAVNK